MAQETGPRTVVQLPTADSNQVVISNAPQVVFVLPSSDGGSVVSRQRQQTSLENLFPRFANDIGASGSSTAVPPSASQMSASSVQPLGVRDEHGEQRIHEEHRNHVFKGTVDAVDFCRQVVGTDAGSRDVLALQKFVEDSVSAVAESIKSKTAVATGTTSGLVNSSAAAAAGYPVGPGASSGQREEAHRQRLEEIGKALDRVRQGEARIGPHGSPSRSVIDALDLPSLRIPPGGYASSGAREAELLRSTFDAQVNVAELEAQLVVLRCMWEQAVVHIAKLESRRPEAASAAAPSVAAVPATSSSSQQTGSKKPLNCNAAPFTLGSNRDSEYSTYADATYEHMYCYEDQWASWPTQSAVGADWSYGQTAQIEGQQMTNEQFDYYHLASEIWGVAERRSTSDGTSGAFKREKPSQIAAVDKLVSLAQSCTTIVLYNLPPTYTRLELMEELNGFGFRRRYDFVYVPLDLKRGQRARHPNMGFAYVNLLSHADAQLCLERIKQSSWAKGPDAMDNAQWATLHEQGIVNQIEGLRNSPVMCSDAPEIAKPLILDTAGNHVAFPPPDRDPRGSSSVNGAERSWSSNSGPPGRF